MEFIFERKGLIQHGCGSVIPADAIEVKNWNGKVGEPWNWYENGCRIPDEKLVEMGMKKDQRGIYYDLEKRTHEIKTFEEIPEEGWIKNKWKHQTDELIEGEWVQNPQKIIEFDQNLLRTKRRSEFFLFDKYQLPRFDSKLTEDQKKEYEDWCQAWEKAPETMVEPTRPDWFE